MTRAVRFALAAALFAGAVSTAPAAPPSPPAAPVSPPAAPVSPPAAPVSPPAAPVSPPAAPVSPPAAGADAAGPSPPARAGAEPTAAAPAYVALWARALERYTKAVPETVGTTVDYAALLAPDGRARWKEILDALAAAEPPETRAARLALWIDAYNILAIDTVLRHYPVDSIRDAGGLFRSVWKLDAGVVAGRAVTLHEIEHEILRPMGDPRIHAAIVCASTSCPSLARRPYTAAAIDAELDAAMRRWLASPTKGLAVDRADDRITVSAIFDWFDEDWDAVGGVRAAVVRWAPESEHAWLARHADDARLAYFDYDWTLNEGPADADR